MVGRAGQHRHSWKLSSLPLGINLTNMLSPKDSVKTIIHYTDSNAFGGTEQALLHMLTGCDRARWRPVLFYHDEPGIKPLTEKAQGLHVKLHSAPRVQTVQDIGRMPQLVRAIKDQRPVVFHAHLTWPLSCKYGLIAAILARVPVVVVTVQLYVEPPKKALLHCQLRLIAAGVDRYLAVSHGVAQRISRLLGLPNEKIQVVHNGICLRPFNRQARDSLRSTLSRNTGLPIILTTARLEEQKGLRYLLEAAAQVPEALFVLAGEGSERGRLEAQARESGIEDRIIFLGYREDIADLLASCDLFVLPSLFEGFPLSILEAMAAGKPVITTAIDGNDEAIVNGETGLLVAPGDPPALAEAIKALLTNPALARSLATAARARVQRDFSAETMVRQVTQIYDELTNSRDPLHADPAGIAP
jgi:glycosyltransferase involved in cell wall biosynthesis